MIKGFSLQYNARDLTGMRFGKLLAKKPVRRANRAKIYWLCDCDCGGKKEIMASQLTKGATKSCGCLHAESVAHADTADATIGLSFAQYRKAAGYRGLVFELSLGVFKELILSRCTYCGVEPDNLINAYVSKSGRYLRSGLLSDERADRAYVRVNGIDRVDNNKGYLSDNTVACCKTCNRAKNTTEYKDWEDWLARLVKFRGQ